MLEKRIKEELISGLLQIFCDSIEQIILYGSVARNEATSESDVDIAIVLDDEITGEIREQFASFVADLDLKYEKVFSVIDIKRSNLEKWGRVLPFYKNIQREGIVLWKAA